MGSALGSIRDTTGRADVERVRSAFDSVFETYRRIGREPRRPISIVIERMPIMGATQSTGEGHVLHIARHATEGGMLDGLIAHEMGHMSRIESGHPSHDPHVHARARARVPVPEGLRRGFARVAHAGINHVEDVYADDLAIPLAVGNRSHPFFAEWVRNAIASPPDPWGDVIAALDIGFALGNLARHDLLPADDPLWGEARQFAARRSVKPTEALIGYYRDLPEPVAPEACEDLLVDLLRMSLDEVRARP